MTDRHQAMKWAAALHTWGYRAIEIIEQYPTGVTMVRCENACSMKRVVRCQADLDELKALEAAR